MSGKRPLISDINLCLQTILGDESFFFLTNNLYCNQTWQEMLYTVTNNHMRRQQFLKKSDKCLKVTQSYEG